MNVKLTTGLLCAALLVMATTTVMAQQPTHKPGGYHSPEIHQGESWSHVFNATGVSYYHCHPHPFMQALVEVKDGASTAPVTIEIRGFKFVPDKIVVGLNTNVTWTNQDASFHTIDESLPGPSETGGGGGSSPGVGVIVGILLLVAAAAVVRSHRQG